MGMRFRKSIKLFGGTRLNISKSGIGISTGVKGFRKSYGANGKTRTTVSVPGTGISYVKESKASGRNNANGSAKVSESKKNSGAWKLVVGILLAIGGISVIGEEIGAAIFGIVAGAALVFWWLKSRNNTSGEKENENTES